MTRPIVLVLAVAGLAATLVPAYMSFAPRVVWNVTASAPIGLYRIEPGASPRIGDLATVVPPSDVQQFIVARGYLPDGVPMLKRIMALPGQTVCRREALILIDDVPLGAARSRDSYDRPLPTWEGCRTLAEGELFFMNPLAPDSLDGRYFGPLPAHAMRGRASPLLTDPDGDGRFHWRADDRELARLISKGDSR